MTIRDVVDGFTSPASFDGMARATVAYQLRHNSVYRRYADAVGGDEERIAHLPVAAFKLAPVATFPPEDAALMFESSGTGLGAPSRHYVKDADVYRRSIAAHFSAVFGDGPFTFVAHLPQYAERGSRSSLLFMVDFLMEGFGHDGSEFFLDDYGILEHAVRNAHRGGSSLLLFGAAFGLLELVEAHSWRLPPNALVIETGGMKTHRREISRQDLHARLAEGFGLERNRVRSEYGMCELLSQCYTRGGEVFYPPVWMRFEVVEPEDPFRILPDGSPGALAVFDLANMYSVSAVLTEDRAVRRGNGFDLLGRLSGAEVRGCNFLLEEHRTGGADGGA